MQQELFEEELETEIEKTCSECHYWVRDLIGDGTGMEICDDHHRCAMSPLNEPCNEGERKTGNRRSLLPYGTFNSPLCSRLAFNMNVTVELIGQHFHQL